MLTNKIIKDVINSFSIGLAVATILSQLVFILILDNMLLGYCRTAILFPRLFIIAMSVMIIMTKYSSVIYLVSIGVTINLLLALSSNNPNIFRSWLVIMVMLVLLLPLPIKESAFTFLLLFPGFILFSHLLVYNWSLIKFLTSSLIFGFLSLFLKYLLLLSLNSISSSIFKVKEERESFSEFISRYKISNHQAQVLKLMFSGEVTHQGIADKMNKSRSNISSTLNRIYDKVGVSNQAELMLNIENIYLDE